MTDILIRGMEMPNGCDSCKLNANGRGCSITGTNYESDTMVLMDFDEYTQRLKDCPLVELPEHGDLIDRDALIKTCNEIIDEDWNAKAAPYSWSYAYESFVDDIVVMPVIVSASKEETE